MTNSLRGVIAAVVTPVAETGSPDLVRFKKHAAWCLENGCDGLNVLGTTGEANSLSAEQRLSVMQAATSTIDGGKMMVGTGTPDLATTVLLTRSAHKLGFGGALLLPPYYYKGLPDEAFFAWFEAVIRATADDPIPLYLYNFPQMTGIEFSPDLARRLFETFPERIAGAKDSSGNLDYAAQLARMDGFDVFPSNEAALAKCGIDGYAGCISATANVTSSMAAALWRDQTNTHLAQQVAAARARIAAQPLIPAIKYLISRVQNDPAFAVPLLPQIPLTGSQMRALDEIDLQMPMN